jgi:hypothetical protein
MQIWQARVCETNKDVVIKFAYDEYEQKKLNDEAMHLRRFHSADIVKVLGHIKIYEDPVTPSGGLFDGLVLEHCPHGDLMEYIEAQRGLSGHKSVHKLMDSTQMCDSSVTSI